MKLWLALAVVVACAPAMAHDSSQWAATPQAERNWFLQQKSPKTGLSCCNQSDFEQVDEEIREGRYWIASNQTRGIWLLVPPEVVIRGPNLHGRAVAWFRFPNGNPEVYCFAPGPLL
jgi:hypothetical protein